MAGNLEGLIQNLRSEETRWDAIVELRALKDSAVVPELLPHLKDPEWVVRWIIAEKLGDFNDSQAIPELVLLLADEDFHVRKNAYRALVKFGKKAVPELAGYFSHFHPDVRKQVYSILLGFGAAILPEMKPLLEGSDWIVANRVLDTIWRIGGAESEQLLIQSISYPFVQKNAIVMLGVMRSTKAIPSLIKAFQIPRLRRLILLSISKIGKETAYPLLVEALDSTSFQVALQAKEAVLRIGPPILPYLVRTLASGSPNPSLLLDLIEKLGALTVIRQIRQEAKRNPDFAAQTMLMRRKYSFSLRLVQFITRSSIDSLKEVLKMTWLFDY